MMKRFIISLAAIFAAVAPIAAQQHTEITTPGAVSSNMELPRSIIVSYNSRDLAFRRDAAGSTYMQYLDGEWKIRKFNNPAEVDISLTLPDAGTTGWQTVTLPETSSGNAAAIYRTEFKMPFPWVGRQIFMHIGPVGRSYYIYVNGKEVGYHEDSRSSAEYDITRYVIEQDKNHLAIVAYANPASAKLEDNNALTGTSLADEVYVIAQPRVRIRDWVVDTRITPNGTDGLINFGAIVKTHLLNTRQVTVHYDLYDPSGVLVYNEKKDVNFGMMGEDTVRFVSTIPAVQTWSGESPVLYTALLRVQHEGRYTEYMTQRIGFRDLAFGDDGFTLNGTPLTLYAADYVPSQDSTAIAHDFNAFRSKGVNAVRVESYPQRQLFYDMADLFGMYVCDQANLDSRKSGASLQVGGTPANDTLWAKAYEERVLNMYHFSRNHPSVIMYSLGKDAGRGNNMYEAYLTLKQKELVRPIIYQGAGAEWNSDIVIGSAKGRNGADTRAALSFMPAATATGTKTEPRISIESLGDSPTQFRLNNGISHTSLNNFEVEYIILRGSRKLATGTVTANIAAGSSGIINIPAEGVRSGEYTLTINVKEKYGTPWRMKGDVVATESTAIRIP